MKMHDQCVTQLVILLRRYSVNQCNLPQVFVSYGYIAHVHQA